MAASIAGVGLALASGLTAVERAAGKPPDNWSATLKVEGGLAFGESRVGAVRFESHPDGGRVAFAIDLEGEPNGLAVEVSREIERDLWQSFEGFWELGDVEDRGGEDLPSYTVELRVDGRQHVVKVTGEASPSHERAIKALWSLREQAPGHRS
jgi:hypothetical protein